MGQVRIPAFVVYNGGYLAPHMFGIGLAHGLGNPVIGPDAGLELDAVCVITSNLMARSQVEPLLKSDTASFWGKN